ncbi:MAG: FAD-dependent oxidoreductase [Deltaproteobacteria bacterium]|nr:FAD-dependent oxidoreductase [Deltaproteobacteria bacterium]
MFIGKVQVPERSSGVLKRVSGEASAIVVGGGLAGIAAATILAERGVSVRLFEREPYLGGRVGAWTERFSEGEPFEMERGFHAFFRQYYNLRSLLRRVDPLLRNLTPLLDYPIVGPAGAMESFAGLSKQIPLNLIQLVQRTPRLNLKDLTHVNIKAAIEMFRYDDDRTYRELDQITARDYLDSLNFPFDARQMLFDVFSHSFFNPEDNMSAGDLLMMFHFYFTGNPEGLIFDVLNEPFSYALWHPFRRYLERLGVVFELGNSVAEIRRADSQKWEVHLENDATAHQSDVVVLAVEVPSLKKIVGNSSHLSDPSFRHAVENLQVTLPFAVRRLFLDRPPKPDRHPFIGTTGLDILDNISIYEMFEGESRRWAMRTGGSVVELHGYALPENIGEAESRQRLLDQLFEVYPELRAVRVLEDRFLLRRDCPAFPPGSAVARPTVQTPMDGLALAGDYVRTPFPSALMERAAATGVMAANHLMQRWNLKPEPLFSVPPKGLLADRYRLPRRGVPTMAYQSPSSTNAF